MIGAIALIMLIPILFTLLAMQPTQEEEICFYDTDADTSEKSSVGKQQISSDSPKSDASV